MPSIVVKLTGLNCDHCEKKLEHALRKIPEVVQAKADHKVGEVNIQFDQMEPNSVDVDQAITSLGYERI